MDGDRPAINAALKHRRFAIPHAGAFGVAGMNEKHAALAAGDESLDVVHPTIAAAQIASTDEQQPAVACRAIRLQFRERRQDRFGGKTNAPIAVENAPRDARL